MSARKTGNWSEISYLHWLWFRLNRQVPTPCLDLSEAETRQQVANLEHITYTSNNLLMEAALLAFGHSRATHKGGPANMAHLAGSTQPPVDVTTNKKRAPCWSRVPSSGRMAMWRISAWWLGVPEETDHPGLSHCAHLQHFVLSTRF